MPTGKNNARIFAETVALDTWRTAFDGERKEADLHIDVVFAEGGRVGGDTSPVRFRLSLRRAEVQVIRDNEGIIQIKAGSVMRADLPKPGRSRTTIEKKGKIGAKAGVNLSSTGANAQLAASADGSINVTQKTEQARVVRDMEITHWRTETGYGFKIASVRSGLNGQPWNSKKPVMKLKDTNARRKRGEPPEIRVEVHCLREDLIIEQIEFTDANFPVWKKLTHLKRIAVEQYIRNELAKSGLPCGDLNDPFTRIILADAMPSIEL